MINRRFRQLALLALVVFAGAALFAPAALAATTVTVSALNAASQPVTVLDTRKPKFRVTVTPEVGFTPFTATVQLSPDGTFPEITDTHTLLYCATFPLVNAGGTWSAECFPYGLPLEPGVTYHLRSVVKESTTPATAVSAVSTVTLDPSLNEPADAVMTAPKSAQEFHAPKVTFRATYGWARDGEFPIIFRMTAPGRSMVQIQCPRAATTNTYQCDAKLGTGNWRGWIHNWPMTFGFFPTPSGPAADIDTHTNNTMPSTAPAFSVVDKFAPTIPRSPKVKKLRGGTKLVTWGRSTDAFGIRGYNVRYKMGTMTVKFKSNAMPSFVLAARYKGGYVSVQAIDVNGNQSLYSAWVAVPR